jgi:hypothetical protein
MCTILSYKGNANPTILRFHLTQVRLAIIKKTNNNPGEDAGEKGTFMHCWWEYKLVQSLGKSV